MNKKFSIFMLVVTLVLALTIPVSAVDGDGTTKPKSIVMPIVHTFKSNL